ncbi:hypothetical protein Q0F98_28615 [Paenibacillus amylolyticus]|nr:hypothetical protein Q0F98_28615 [Paenibacillus amylolyticus]
MSDLDAELLQEDIETMRGRVDAKTAELQRIQSGGELSSKEIRLREINAELSEIKHRVQADSIKAVNDHHEWMFQLGSELSGLKSQIDAGEREVEQYKRQITRAENQAARLLRNGMLRMKWNFRLTNMIMMVTAHPADKHFL